MGKSIFLKFHRPLFAYVYYKQYRLNLLTGLTEQFSLNKLHLRLSDIKINQHFENPHIIHLFYEFGYYYTGNEDKITENDIMAIEIKYQDVSSYKVTETPRPVKLYSINEPDFNLYKKKFSEGYRYLIRGESYQFNLTFQYKFRLDDQTKFNHLISKLWQKENSCSAYAHATVIPKLETLFLSNSPECLFQIRKKKNSFDLWTMPIKGSIQIEQNKIDAIKKWKQLQNCKKNQAELDMISDLLRNDLSKIEKPTAKIQKRKCPLYVPGIVHQYSLISVNLTYNTNLGNIISSIFPGGSITGAPKKRTMEILEKLENCKRGLYCGSTIILYKSILAGSINIRSATVNSKANDFSYHAGGGITLNSDPYDEFMEMKTKVKSFTNLLIDR